MGWTLFFMMVVLKIPLAAACYLIWYAIHAEPETEEEPGTDKGPRRKLPPFPRWPRRGPAGGAGGACKAAPCETQAPTSLPAPLVARSRDVERV
jgi:hypothetical protein